jgi:glycosyltransferase involved in cell wall biosynthesis
MGKRLHDRAAMRYAWSFPEQRPTMRIGIDGSCLSNRRGFGRFARRLLEALSRQATHHRFTVFVDRPSSATVRVPERFDRVVVAVGEAPSRAASAQGRRRWRDMLAMGRAVARSGVDLIYFPATYSFFPVWGVGKLVVTVHDTLPLSHPELVFPRLSGRLAWRLKEAVAARWADRIVTVSHASRRAIEDWLGRPDPRIRVITEGADPIFGPRADGPESEAVLQRHGLCAGQRFLLYVGGLSPHKNLLRLVEAFARSPRSDVRLVLTGDVHDVFHTHVPEIRATIERHELGDRVLLTGFVPDEDLVYLYGRAYALVQPSLLEGFGLPAVEAMACGTPVISSRAGSLPEVVGEAGVYFDPTQVDSIAEAIRGLLAEPSHRATLARLALERSARFTWDASASALLDCFDELEHASPHESALSRSA